MGHLVNNAALGTEPADINSHRVAGRPVTTARSQLVSGLLSFLSIPLVERVDMLLLTSGENFMSITLLETELLGQVFSTYLPAV